MSDLVTDPNDPRLGHGADDKQTSQHDAYLVLSEEERGKGFVRPYRETYIHLKCGVVTKIGRELSETYARNPHFYGSTYCVSCKMHLPLKEFNWDGTHENLGWTEEEYQLYQLIK
jgi:hypothetical protein